MVDFICSHFSDSEGRGMKPSDDVGPQLAICEDMENRRRYKKRRCHVTARVADIESANVPWK